MNTIVFPIVLNVEIIVVEKLVAFILPPIIYRLSIVNGSEGVKEMNVTLDPNTIYSANQLAKALHISTRTVYYMVKRGEIPYVRITPDSHIRFPGWQIRQWIDTKMEGGGRNHEDNEDLRTQSY